MHMSGVNLLYHIKIRSKKWYLRILFHMMNDASVNVWLMW